MKVDINQFKTDKNLNPNNSNEDQDKPCEKRQWQKPKEKMKEINENQYVGFIPLHERMIVEKEKESIDKFVPPQKEKRENIQTEEIICVKCKNKFVVPVNYKKLNTNFMCDKCIAEKVRDFI